MASTLSVKKNGAVRSYVGGELIYVDAAKTKQVKNILVLQNGSQKLIWQYDTTAPVIKVNQSTTDVYYVNSNSFTLSGTVTDDESKLASFKVNGNEVAVTNNSWSTTITLSSGSQTHTIQAIDNAGNTSYAYVRTYYDNVAPTISVTSSTAVRNNASYTLTGTITDSASGVVSVTINGSSVSLSGSTFSKNYTLGEGITSFTINATDKCGNTSSKTVSITYVNTSTAATVIYAQARHGYEGGWGNISLGSDGWYSATYSDSSGPTTYGSTARTWAQMQVAYRHKVGVKYMYSGTSANREQTWKLITDSGTTIASGSGGDSFTATVPDAYINRSDLYLYVWSYSYNDNYAGSGYTANSSATVRIKKCTVGI